MEAWRSTWRKGILPFLNVRHLEVLMDALQSDDPRLVQGATTIPKPLQCTQTWPVECACALTFMGWQADDKHRVGEAEEWFAVMCHNVDQHLGEPAGIRWFLCWYDDTPREEMRKELLQEVIFSIGVKKMVKAIRES